MKKLFLTIVLLTGLIGSAWAQNYDFSAVAPSGQTLYYAIDTANVSNVIVTSGEIQPTGNLVIPSSVTHNGNTYSVTAISGECDFDIPVFGIGGGLGYSGGGAFSDCTGLISVTIPHSVTAIGFSSFSNCTGLTTVNFNSTHLEEINASFDIGLLIGSLSGWEPFSGCSALTTINIGENVESIPAFLFARCTSLTTITIPSSVTHIDQKAFYGCTGLTTVNFNATNMNDFDNNVSPFGPDFCPALATFNVGNSARRIPAHICQNCTGLTSLSFGNSVDSICTDAFAGCTGLTSVTLPTSVTYLNGFNGCTGLTAINIPNSVITIGSGAFDGCTGLTSVTIPNSVINLSGFAGCSGLTSVTIGNSVRTIGGGAFYNCTGITTISIPNSVVSIGGGAFYGSGLTRVNYTGTIAQWCNIDFEDYSSNPIRCSLDNSYSVDEDYNLIWNNAFNFYINDVGISELVIPEGVTQIKQFAFAGCIGLTSVTIPNTVTTIGSYAFNSCYRLASVTIPESVTSIGYGAFSGCDSLTSVTIPESVTTIGIWAFGYCNSLTSVTIPESVTSIGFGAFGFCNSLTSVNFNAISMNETETTYWYNGVLYYAYYEGSGLARSPFPGDSALATIHIGENVQRIPAKLFSHCTGLTEITFPNSVTAINDSAFYNCDHLTTMTFKGIQPPTFGTDVFSGVPSNCIVNVPCGRQALYIARLLEFTNFVEEGIVFAAESADESMGEVQVLTVPTCANPNAVLYAVPNSGYLFDHWSTGSTANPYAFTVTDSMVVTAYFVAEGTTPTTNAPTIACVTVDQNNHNVVRWEPRDTTTPVRYNIYREGLGGFSVVGTVDFTDAAEYSWVDDTANVAAQAYSYKLSEVYADNSESDLSVAHTTMHLQINQGQNGMNLTWTPYEGFEYDGYRIYSGTSANSMSLLTTLAASNTAYSDVNGTSTTLYQIEVVPSSSRSISVSSRSNITSAEAPTSYTLTVTSADSEMGSVVGGGTYQPGEQATIEATPNSGYRFDYWSDGSTQASRIVTVTGDATYIAYFASTQPADTTDITDTTGLVHYDLIDLTLYPNPTTGIVTVRLSPETCTLNPEIQVFDIYGRRLQNMTVAGETTQIDLSQYATGIYLVKLVNDGKVVATGKVVKQ